MTLSLRTRFVYLLVTCALLALLALPVFATGPAGQLTSAQRADAAVQVEPAASPVQIACTGGGSSQGSCGGG